MKINWLIRFKNPIFWVQVGAAFLLPILAYFGLTLEQLSSWGMLGDTLIRAIANPYVVGTVLVSVWSAVNDPTTKGARDSERALAYKEPRG